MKMDSWTLFYNTREISGEYLFFQIFKQLKKIKRKRTKKEKISKNVIDSPVFHEGHSDQLQMHLQVQEKYI